MTDAAIERLEWRRNARELGAKREALDLAPEGRREEYAARVLAMASCVVDYPDLCHVLERAKALEGALIGIWDVSERMNPNQTFNSAGRLARCAEYARAALNPTGEP